MLLLCITLGIAVLCPLAALAETLPPGSAATLVREDVSVGFLPLGWVAPELRKALSPQGKFQYLSLNGPVRITDAPARIEAVRRALAELQAAPAIVPVDLSFTTTTTRTVRRSAPLTPSEMTGIPVPSRYDPPRIIANGNGSVTVIPATPHFEKPRDLSSSVGAVIEEEVRDAAVARRFSASLVLNKRVDLPVLRASTDTAALRALALQAGAIDATEPVWLAAGTELSLRAELSVGVLILNVTPQIVVTGAPGAAPRRIPLLTCAGAVPIKRGDPPATGTLKNVDAGFFRTFLGTPQVEDGTLAALKVEASVNYIGGPPK